MGQAVLGTGSRLLFATTQLEAVGHTGADSVSDPVRRTAGSPVLELVQHHVHRTAKTGRVRLLGRHAAVCRPGHNTRGALLVRFLCTTGVHDTLARLAE